MADAKRVLLSVLGKVSIIIIIAVAFMIGLVGTVFLSLRSPEVAVPNIVGKSLQEGEAILEAAKLKRRVRATRFTLEAKPETILDQSPRAGETVKTGQTVAVVVSRVTTKEGEVAAPVADNEEGKSGEEATARNTNEPKTPDDKRRDNNQNKNTGNRNANRNKNTNNRNANNSNANRSVNANANRKTANRNVTLNVNRNSNSATRNSNSVNKNTNANRRPPAPVVAPSATNSNRGTP